MKNKLNGKTFLATAALSVGMASPTSHANVMMYGDSCPWWERGAVCAFGDSVYATCAPEVKQGNVAATERTLNELAQGDLKDSVDFKSSIVRISKLDPNQRISAYLSLAGVQSDDDIAQFLGAREVNSKNVEAISRNLNLSREQAVMVINKLATALLGERK